MKKKIAFFGNNVVCMINLIFCGDSGLLNIVIDIISALIFPPYLTVVVFLGSAIEFSIQLGIASVLRQC